VFEVTPTFASRANILAIIVSLPHLKMQRSTIDTVSRLLISFPRMQLQQISTDGDMTLLQALLLGTMMLIAVMMAFLKKIVELRIYLGSDNNNNKISLYWMRQI